ncbi:MAG: GGDEF domain-containing protein [Sulfitobacter sp.]
MSAQSLQNMLDVFCPMHICLDRHGVILSVGPTTCKLRPDLDWTGQNFFDVFNVKRPNCITSPNGLRGNSGIRLHLALCGADQSDLKGVLMPIGDDGVMVLNLSFGISILDAVRDYALTAADFAATDLTIEMLYLIEANSAAMAASRSLSQRLQNARAVAEEQALTDTLTGLKNRRATDSIIDSYIGKGMPFALMHIDLDYFKAVNDTMGHAAGDFVLQEVARIMIDATRSCDTVARVGGDEFVILVDGIQSCAELGRIGTRIIEKLQEPIPFQGQLCLISASIGTAMSQAYDTANADMMMQDADAALYASKNAGRACQTFFQPEMRKSDFAGKSTLAG